jgi:hypothetical protein
MRPEIKEEYVLSVLNDPEHVEEQGNGFFAMWRYIDEEAKYLRIITWPDRDTVENAFFDRGYKRR